MSSEFRLPASLVLNVVLAATVVVLVLHKTKHAPAPSAREASLEGMAKETITHGTPVFTRQPGLPKYTDIASESDRLKWLMDQLRALGVPNRVMGQVAHSDLDENWDQRFVELGKSGKADAHTMSALQLQREKEMDAEMRAALGPEGYKQWDEGNMLREANTANIQLTDAESNAIYDIKKKLQQRCWDAEQARLNGEIDDATASDEQSKAYTELNQQMKALLGDDRYAESQGMDAGTAANNLRHDMAGANPTDSQFQDLLKSQQQFNDSRAALDKKFQDDPSNPDYAAQLQALNDAHDQQYQSVLGTNVFATLQKQQDPGYTMMKQYASAWNLNDNQINYVYGSIQYYQKSVQDYQAQAQALQAQGQSVDWDAVNKNLQQFKEQTQQGLQNYLGQDNFNKMQRNGVFPFNEIPHH